ncbi:MAG: hypothetical protein IKV94_03700 [Clostridia bacterium]|nr:hypothetical protein [Clostridia bacterium]
MTIVNLSDSNEIESEIKNKLSEIEVKNIRIYLINDMDNLVKITNVKAKKNILITTNLDQQFIRKAVDKANFLIYGKLPIETIIDKIKGCL